MRDRRDFQNGQWKCLRSRGGVAHGSTRRFSVLLGRRPRPNRKGPIMAPVPDAEAAE